MSETGPAQIDIFVMTADGRTQARITVHPAEDQLLRWTADGRGLLFLSDRSGTWDVWVAHISGGKPQGEPELLKKDFGYHQGEVLGLSPDGALYYTTESASGGLYGCEIDPDTGRMITPPVQLTTMYTGPRSQPTWSPDGRHLAYVSRRGPTRPSWHYYLGWSRDGRYVVARPRDGSNERWMIPSEGGVPKIWKPDSTLPKMTGSSPHPDNRRYAFIVDGGTKSELWVLENLLTAAKPPVR